ncbi:MAG: glycosyltransferase 87 family protein [Mycobacterium sp.]
MAIADDERSREEHKASDERSLKLSRVGLVVLVAWSVASVVALCVTVNPLTPQNGFFRGNSDYFVYRDAAWHVVQGLPLYEHQLFEEHWWTYTPFAALVFLPFEFLPTAPDETGADQYIWMAVNFILLIAVVVRCWQMLGYRVTRYLIGISTLIAFGSLFLEPVRSTLFFGQVNLLLLVLILWDASREDDSRLKGVGIGISAGIKLTPGFFVFFYLGLRRWRAAAVAVGTTLATVAVGWLVLPTDSTEYWTKTFFDSSRVDEDLDHPANQSLRGMMARLSGDAPAPWLWLLLAVTIAVLSLYVAMRLYRRDEQLLSVTVVGMSAAVVSPYSWTHHWVWFVPLVVYFMHRAVTSPRWWVCIVGLSALIGCWAYTFDDDPSDPRVGLYLFPTAWVDEDVLRNLYLWLFVLFLIWAAAVSLTGSAGAAATLRPRQDRQPSRPD